jgi:DNA-binding IclR family transcriptional regulator
MERAAQASGVADGERRAKRRRAGGREDTAAWPDLPDNVVKSAGRALQILEYFDHIREPANLIMVCRALNLPQSSASMLMRSLVALGYLQVDLRTRTYRPTGRSALLGAWIEPLLTQEGPLLRAMRDVAERTRTAAVLSARNRLNAQDIYVVDRREDGRTSLAVGRLRSLPSSVTGQMLLSALPDGEIAKILRRINADERGDGVVRLDDLLKRIHEARQTGHLLAAADAGGTAALAMAVPHGLTRGEVVATFVGVRAQVFAAPAALASLLPSALRTAGAHGAAHLAKTSSQTEACARRTAPAL